TRRRPAPVLKPGASSSTPLADSTGAVPATSLDADNATAPAEPTWERSPVPVVAASEVDER
ncbi:MAG: hypothetical protein ACRDPA_11000, partial [Solirubrobacteraceae bacterium]